MAWTGLACTRPPTISSHSRRCWSHSVRRSEHRPAAVKRERNTPLEAEEEFCLPQAASFFDTQASPFVRRSFSFHVSNCKNHLTSCFKQRNPTKVVHTDTHRPQLWSAGEGSPPLACEKIGRNERSIIILSSSWSRVVGSDGLKTTCSSPLLRRGP